MKPLVIKDLVVATKSGRVRGEVIGGVSAFKGIPYAAPPFGPRHLRPPQPVEAWDGVRDALEFGPKAPQADYPPQIAMMLPEFNHCGEHCLTLNIWTPHVTLAGLPVMVWIPGGMFEYHGTSACPWYDGTAFACDGIVCVTINYRVGAEGFLYLSPGTANRGLLDQIAALEWVRDNIRSFGGDPHNVTVFGESAGALSIGALLAMPQAKGLFGRAILQSGGAQHALPLAAAEKVTQRFAAAVGTEPTLEAMAALPSERLVRAQEQLRADLSVEPDPEIWGAEVVLTNLPWQPVVDGESLPDLPLSCVAEGASKSVDLMIGTNVDENRLFLVPGGVIDHVTEEVMAGVASSYGLSDVCPYREAKPSATPGDLMAAIQTDWYWRIPSIRLADAQASARGSTHMYEFAWPSPQFDGRLGACHASEISFVFDTLGNQTDYLLGPNPPQSLADQMHRAWIEFATTGDPGWAAYDTAHRTTMRFGIPSEVVDDPRSWERGVWEGLR